MIRSKQFGSPIPQLGSQSLVHDRDQLSALSSAVYSMQRQIDEFLADIVLFDFSMQNDELVASIDGPFAGEYPISWMHIAARDGAIRILDFSEALQGANSALAKCSIHAVKSAEKSAFKLLDDYFPERLKIRHSAAHTAESVKSAAGANKHRFKGSFDNFGIKIEGEGSIHIQDMISDRQYVGTWGGEIVSYELSLASLHRLEEVKQAFLSTIPSEYIFTWPA